MLKQFVKSRTNQREEGWSSALTVLSVADLVTQAVVQEPYIQAAGQKP